MILIKRGVVVCNIQDERVLEPAYIADRIWRGNGWGDVVITSCIDGNHMNLSYHYGAGAVRGQAIDLRLPSFATGNKTDDAKAVEELKKAMPHKTILLENDHIHCQPGPRT